MQNTKWVDQMIIVANNNKNNNTSKNSFFKAHCNCPIYHSSFISHSTINNNDIQ